jgi:hypothetical protein
MVIVEGANVSPCRVEKSRVFTVIVDPVSVDATVMVLTVMELPNSVEYGNIPVLRVEPVILDTNSVIP